MGFELKDITMSFINTEFFNLAGRWNHKIQVCKNLYSLPGENEKKKKVGLINSQTTETLTVWQKKNTVMLKFRKKK